MQGSHEAKDFISLFWHTAVRDSFTRDEARSEWRERGARDDVQRYLRAVMADSRSFMAAWEQLTNLGVYSPEELREDATDLWTWLFGE